MKTGNTIFKLMLGTSVLILSIAVLIFVSKPAAAGSAPATPFMPVEESAGGKYTLQYQMGQESDGSFFWQMVIFNRATGAYRAYVWDRDTQGWETLFPEHKPFPSLP